MTYTYETAVEELYSLRRFGKETGAVRATKGLELLHHPERDLSIIHLAGTNGKGSTSAFMHNSLIKLGFNVGLFTSPHLVTPNERIRLNNDLITNEEFLAYFLQVKEITSQVDLAFFDFMFLMAMLYYQDHKPDYVILETGLGGGGDATASLSHKLLSIITSISFDHTEILGDTLEKIAKEKAGILLPGVPVVYLDREDGAARVIAQEATRLGCPSYPVKSKELKGVQSHNHIDFSMESEYYSNSLFSINNVGLFQMENAALALTSLGVLARVDQRVGSCWKEEKVLEGIQTMQWPGRMESLGERVYLDGAHNPDGIAKFLETVRAFAKEPPVYLLFGAVMEKDVDAMIREIVESGLFNGFVITQIPNHRKLPASVMEQEFRKYTTVPMHVKEDVGEAFAFAKSLGGFLFIAGSLYLVGEIKSIGEKEEKL